MPANTVDIELATRLLKEAVAANPKGKSGVGRRLGPGCGRVMISRVLSESDALVMTTKMARRVIDVYHVIPECPATGLPQPRMECLRLSKGSAPTHNPLAMRIWKACRTCSHCPKGDAK